MVGQRFAAWFEASPADVWRPQISGIDIVVLSFEESASKAILNEIQKSSFVFQ